MRCQICGKKTHVLNYWMDKMLCKNCYKSSLVGSEVMPEITS